ncbi:alpha/beta fold hydrolase [Cellulophaga baltica]|uniref:alpha/beta fold hydrolase n=1 Tax=Cellulophaga baltica TaxID=76594 RepID=UPI0003F6748E|nr:alpha/beta hydrolase [Cellulophaga baltica]AIY14898.1 alpha/beta hydrolase [Cellulophaga baltica NN016038]
MKRILILFLLQISFGVQAQKQFFISFDGIEIAYTDEGKGKAVVLVHGFINDGSSWNATVLKKELLQKGYRVIVPDLRGNGSSGKPQEEKFYTDDAEVRDLQGLTSYLNLKKFTVVGYSRGSIITAKWLTVDMHIKKSVLGGMGLDFTNPEWNRRILFANAFAEGAELTEETKGAVAYAISVHADLKALHYLQKHQPVTSVFELGQIKSKVLIVAGDEDLENGNPKALHKAIPESAFVLLKGNHNDVYKTDSFSKAIISFLK